MRSVEIVDADRTYLRLQEGNWGVKLCCPVCGGPWGYTKSVGEHTDSVYKYGSHGVVIAWECGHTVELIVGNHKGDVLLAHKHITASAQAPLPLAEKSVTGQVPSRLDRAATAEWLDPLVCPPPKGTKIQLLTAWGIAVYGHWADDGYVAWAPLLQKPAWLYERLRQKRLEKEDLR